MMKHLLAIGIVLSLAAPAALAQEELPADDTARVDFLVAAMGNQDENIRREALRRLRQDEDLPATAPLVAHLQSSDLTVATRAATALIGRLDFLRRNPNPDGPRLILLDEDRQHLAALRAILDNDRAAHWRWYLAAHVIQQVEPDKLADSLPAFLRELKRGRLLRQYAAVRAINHIGAGAGEEAKLQLLAVLGQTNRPKFEGIYMRYDRIIESNAVAFSADVRVYDAAEQEYRYYANDDLLVIDTLIPLGVSFEEVGDRLKVLSSHENESVQLQAASLLNHFDDAGKILAATTLDRLLRDRESLLVRDLAEEDERTRQEDIDLVAGLEKSAGPVVEALALLLNTSRPQLRNSAALALGRLGPTAKDAAPALQRAIEMELLVGDAPSQVSPLARQRAEQRLSELKQALEQVSTPFGDDT